MLNRENIEHSESDSNRNLSVGLINFVLLFVNGFNLFLVIQKYHEFKAENVEKPQVAKPTPKHLKPNTVNVEQNLYKVQPVRGLSVENENLYDNLDGEGQSYELVPSKVNKPTERAFIDTEEDLYSEMPHF